MSAKEENEATEKLANESAKTVELSRRFHEALRKSGPPSKRDSGPQIPIVPLYTPPPMMSPFAGLDAAEVAAAAAAAALSKK